MDRTSAKIYATNGGTFLFATATPTLSELEAVFKIALLAATLVYTLIKCWKLARSKSPEDTITFTKEK